MFKCLIIDMTSPNQRRGRVDTALEALRTGGLSLISDRLISEPTLEQTGEADPQPAITAELIHEQFGYRLAVTCPYFETEAAAVVDFHDEQERLGREFGWDKVIGSLFFEDGEVKLGVFVDESVIPLEETS